MTDPSPTTRGVPPPQASASPRRTVGAPASQAERPELDEGGPPDLAHYARNDELAAARKEGRAVKALCGTLFRPHPDPSNLAVCVVCVDLAAAYRR